MNKHTTFKPYRKQAVFIRFLKSLSFPIGLFLIVLGIWLEVAK